MHPADLFLSQKLMRNSSVRLRLIINLTVTGSSERRPPESPREPRAGQGQASSDWASIQRGVLLSERTGGRTGGAPESRKTSWMSKYGGCKAPAGAEPGRVPASPPTGLAASGQVSTSLRPLPHQLKRGGGGLARFGEATLTWYLKQANHNRPGWGLHRATRGSRFWSHGGLP